MVVQWAAAKRQPAVLKDIATYGLPEDYRLVVVLRYWHDFGYAEIAELSGESESAIKSRLHRARRQLAELLTGGDDDMPAVGRGSCEAAADANGRLGATGVAVIGG